jgi:hypothetical protein
VRRPVETEHGYYSIVVTLAVSVPSPRDGGEGVVLVFSTNIYGTCKSQ